MGLKNGPILRGLNGKNGIYSKGLVKSRLSSENIPILMTIEGC